MYAGYLTGRKTKEKKRREEKRWQTYLSSAKQTKRLNKFVLTDINDYDELSDKFCNIGFHSSSTRCWGRGEWADRSF